MRKPLLLLITLLSAVVCSQGALIDFALIPASGSVVRPGASTAGWGYVLTNNSEDRWLVTTALNADPFLYSEPTVLFDFPVLSPGSSVSVAYDADLMTGLYAVQVAANAPSGFVEQGLFVLSGEWWSGDPAGSGLLIGPAEDSSVAWQLRVAVVPEPHTFLPVVLALSVLYRVRLRLQK